MLTKEQKSKKLQEKCLHDGLFTVEQPHYIREKDSQEIIAEAKARCCVKCGFTKGHVMGAWDPKGIPFETKPGQNHEVAARDAFKAAKAT